MVCADHCAYLLKKDFSEIAYDGKKLAEVLEFGLETYKYDMVLVFSDPYVEAQALGCQVEFSPYPKLLAPSKLIKCHSEFSPESPGFDRTAEIVKAAIILKQKIKVPVFVSIKGPFSLASFLGGIEDFLTMLLIDKAKVKNFIDQAVRFQLEYIEKIISLGVNIFIGDPMASASIISPELFRKFAYEPLKILIKKVKETGLIVGLHICGETLPIIPMLDQLNADILSLEDITPKTKTLKMGGVSTTTIFSGNSQEIEAEVRKALTESYLILATSCDVPIETDPENIKTMIKIGVDK